jgi:thiamine biosynthesis lipoprotein
MAMTLELVGQTAVSMDTFVTIQVACAGRSPEVAGALDRAFDWFRQVDERCTRFNAASEVMGLTAQAGRAVEVSPLLYEAIRFALEVARASGGAFDPTVGRALEARGFNHDYRTGQTIDSDVDPNDAVSYRDVELDPARHSVRLRRPLVLDLGAVAKGLAIDLAARELRPLEHFSINAGGDVYVGGHNAEGEPWRVGIRHPREPGTLLETLYVSDVAVCTSGDYERPSGNSSAEHHILDPHTGHSPAAIASLTVVAPTAMVADALGTAAFVLGPERGLAFLEREGVEGALATPSLELRSTKGYARYRAWH